MPSKKISVREIRQFILLPIDNQKFLQTIRQEMPWPSPKRFAHSSSSDHAYLLRYIDQEVASKTVVDRLQLEVLQNPTQYPLSSADSDA
jgi:hypothetical protein